MFSPGQNYKQVPRDPYLNHLFRQKILKAAVGNPVFQKAIIDECRKDILFFINVFVWQVNPKKKGKEIGPFITWRCQDKWILTTLRYLMSEVSRDMVWEKSREMGATWMAIIIALWLCLFHPNKRVIMVSHSEEAVTKPGDDAGTLFSKIKFILDYLPQWMTKGVDTRRKGISFPNRSSISGLASTGRSGVGDRVAFVLLDEFSKQRDAYDIWGQTADTGNRLVIGTHYGVGGKFYDLTREPTQKKLVMHWSEHPDKNKGLYRWDEESGEIEVLDKKYDYRMVVDWWDVDDEHPLPPWQFQKTAKPAGPFAGLRSPWYDWECLRRNNSRDVAMHLDIDPQGATSQFFDAQRIADIRRVYARPPLWEGDLWYDPDLGQPKELIYRKGGPLRLWVNPKPDGTLPVGNYGLGGDIAAGTGATPTCFVGLQVDEGDVRQVLEFADANINNETAAAYFVALCWLMSDRYGNGARACWEVQGPGVLFGRRVLELGYRNCFRRHDESTPGSKQQESYGWVPTTQNRRTTLEAFRGAVQTRQCVIRSALLLEETLNFVYSLNGTVDHGRAKLEDDPSRARENHGDRVVGGALAWKMIEPIANPAAQQEEEERELTVGSIAGRREFRRQRDAEQEEDYAYSDW